MGLTSWNRRCWLGCGLRGMGWVVLGLAGLGAAGQSAVPTSAPSERARRFLAGRSGAGAAQGMAAARQEHAAMVAVQAAQESQLKLGIGAKAVAGRTSSLSTAWQPVGPGSVTTAAYGAVSGRVTALAIDPADATGNTIYVGATGGGVWKSVNAAGALGSVSFVPLTDDLPVFSANAGTAAIPSLSIGALSVGQVSGGEVLLAGTGDPNDATDSYYGTGVLRSADGGLTWTLAQSSNDGVAGHHSFVGLGFAGFAWSSTTSGLVVAAVSQAMEGTVVNAADTATTVVGLYYSTDAGVTWQMSVIMDGSQVVQSATIGDRVSAGTAVVWNAARQRFFAAVRYHGYYQSVDGATWTRLTSQPGTGLTTTACPASTLVSCPIFRGALAVQTATGDMFALSVDGNNADQGLWQDVCAAGGSGCGNAVAFGTRLGGTALEVGGGSTKIFQGDYNLTLAAASAGSTDTMVYVGTVDVYRCSLAAGCALRNTTNAAGGCGAPARVAPDQHAIAAMAGLGGQPLVYIGNDGGIWRSLDGINEQQAVCSADDATHFDDLNAAIGSLAEVVSFAQDPVNTGALLVGLGANGTAGTANALTTAAWGQLATGEGGNVVIDATNSSLWYVSIGPGVNIKLCQNGSACAAGNFAGTATVGEAQVSGDLALVDAAWMLDPLSPAEVTIGTCRVWRGAAASAGSWSTANAISTMFGGSQGAACVGTNSLVRSLGAGGPLANATSVPNAGATVLYAGLAGSMDGGGTLGGHVFSTQSAGTANPATVWTDVGLSPVTNDLASAGKFNKGQFDVSSVTVDAHDGTGKTVYVTVMGFAGNTVNAPHVYQSVDGGAHWTNISGNLPNAPANALVVDPNDANTVYVAMDTGVYVTAQVANCSTTNCWSVYGTDLPNAPAIQLAAGVGLATGDGRTGELRVGTYGRGIWQIPLLTGATVTAAAGMSVAPTALTFGTQATGTSSATQTVTVTNTGNAPLVVSQVAVTGDFHTTNGCIGNAVAAGGTCAVQVSFLPSATGARSGLLTVYGNVPGGQAPVTLAGTAVAGATIVLNPVTSMFAATVVGTTGATNNVTISNTGGVTSVLASISVSGDFAIAVNTCGSTLAAGVGCTVAIAFSPTASGVRSGVLTVVDDAGTQMTALSGTGTSAATDGLSPLSLTFGAQQLNTASAAQMVTLTNSGDVALTLIAVQITTGDFTAANGCGNSLNAHSSCAIAVTFVPKSVGAESGLLKVTDQFRVQTVVLNGTGVAPPGVSLTPAAALTFGATAVGSGSAGQTVTLTNNGGVPLSLVGVAVAGDFAVVAGSNTCGSSLAVGAACSLQVSFVPTTGGPRNGTVTVTDSALNSPQTLALTGTGVDFTLTANGSASVTVPNGTSATFPLLLSSAASVPGTALLGCTGAPANTICTISPGSAGLGGTTTVSLIVQTATSTAAVRRPSSLLWLALILPVGWLARRRRRMPVLLLLCLLAGCGGNRSVPLTSSGGAGPLTPSGTYTVVASASSAGLTRTVNLTLVVQ